MRRATGIGILIEECNEEHLPIALPCVVTPCTALDIISDDGCRAAGLPASCVSDTDGQIISHDICQPIGRQALEAGLDAVAYRSAGPPDVAGAQELAWFDRPGIELTASGPAIPSFDISPSA